MKNKQSALKSEEVVPAKGRLTQKEHKEEGAISSSTLLFFIRNMGGYHVFVLCGVCCSWVMHLIDVVPDIFLAAWQDDLLSTVSNLINRSK